MFDIFVFFNLLFAFLFGNVVIDKKKPTKSQCLTLSRRRKAWQIPPIVFGGTEVPEFEEIKLLGTLIDHQLTHAPQLREMALKARQRAGFSRRASRYLDAKGNACVVRSEGGPSSLERDSPGFRKRRPTIPANAWLQC